MQAKIVRYSPFPVFASFFFNDENVQNSVHNVKNFAVWGLTV